MMAVYKIQGARLAGIADQARRLGGVIGELSPEQIERTLAGVTPTSDLPDAEDAMFGTPVLSFDEYMISWDTASQTNCNSWGGGTVGIAFTVKEAFAVVGFRGMVRWAGEYIYKIWDKDTQTAIATLQVTFSTEETWEEFMMAQPVNLEAGKTYAVTVYGSSQAPWTTYSILALMNSKVNKAGDYKIDGADSYPTTAMNQTAPVDLLITAVSSGGDTPQVAEYKIQTQTLTYIADEVMRITGGSLLLTPAEIITALQSVPVQTTE